MIPPPSNEHYILSYYAWPEIIDLFRCPTYIISNWRSVSWRTISRLCTIVECDSYKSSRDLCSYTRCAYKISSVLIWNKSRKVYSNTVYIFISSIYSRKLRSSGLCCSVNLQQGTNASEDLAASFFRVKMERRLMASQPRRCMTWIFTAVKTIKPPTVVGHKLYYYVITLFSMNLDQWSTSSLISSE
jgi:hypothetical protein